MILSIINSIALIIVFFYYFRKKIKKLNKRNLPKRIKVGRHSYASSSDFDAICSHSDTTIGSFCSVAGGVKIGPSEHPIDYLSTHGFQYSKECYGFINENNLYDVSSLTKPCSIGHDVWIGQDATIKSGVKIGHGAIVGCGAVVTKDVPPYAIVVGVPAQIKRYRFDKETITELLELKWWDYPEKILVTLPYNNISECMKILKIYRNVK